MSRGIRQRIISTYLYVILISMIVLGVFLVWLVHDYNLSNMRQMLANEARLVSGLIKDEVMWGQFTKVDQEAKLLGSDLHARITVILPDGRVIGDTRFDPSQLENHKSRPEVKTALAGGVGQQIRFSTSSIIEDLYVAVPIEKDGSIEGVVRFAVPLSDVRHTFFKFFGWLMTGIILSTLVGILIFLKVAKGLTDPLENISVGTKKLAAGEWQTKIYSVPGDEIGELGQSIKLMTKTLKDQIDEVSQGKSRLENIVNTMASGVIVLDEQGVVLIINQAAEKMFGIRFTAAQGKHCVGVIRHFGLNEQIAKCLSKAGVIDYEFTVYFPEEKHVRCSIAPVFRDQSLGGVTVVFHDITDLRQVERMRSDFVANASHELRTPLTVIRGYAETLLSGALDDLGTREKFVSIIEQEAERLQRLVDELLTLSRSESGDREGSREPVLLTEVASSVVEELRPRFDEKAIALEMLIGEGVESILADGDRMKQVVFNLLENALKYTLTGGKVQVAVGSEGDSVQVSVSDTGIGIPAKDLPRIFERFYRVDKARSRQIGGFGLGLSIARHIVENYGGRIGVKSIQDQGSTFWFSMPKKS